MDARRHHPPLGVPRPAHRQAGQARSSGRRPHRTKRTAKPGSAAAANQSHALNPSLRVTHPERVIDPSTGITKIELVRYYGLVGELMLPHLKGRPVSLVRAPSGVDGQLFFQKHAETEKLPGIRQLDPALCRAIRPCSRSRAAEGLLSRGADERRRVPHLEHGHEVAASTPTA